MRWELSKRIENTASEMSTMRRLRKWEKVSGDKEHVYECDVCMWMLVVSPDRVFSDIQSEFDRHDCKQNSLKKRPINYPR
jgi:hypothetical protein